MSKQDFERYLADQKQQEVEAFDADRQLQEWRDLLADLYRDVHRYMAAYVNQGSAKITFKEIELNEDFSGPYKVHQLNLQITNSVVTFKPIGTMLIGTKGRVDVQGPRGMVRLMLVGKHIRSARDLIKITTAVVTLGQTVVPPPTPKPNTTIDWVWKIAGTPPAMTFTDLDESTFFDMILAVINA
ncbi:hypothetical protein J2792_000543 [Novosphingobium capsulatum]|uniref:Uncharacterized protein n=1 Tax=Novosphingobium capsulatum TaxID=13688 RepID=A0ABU1MH89_9SPHN|nr:hypothetical protein [Novosphingobium capsulatum]MDR6509703.1 hypothetical protein [Novosphingobium capsulatum]